MARSVLAAGGSARGCPLGDVECPAPHPALRGPADWSSAFVRFLAQSGCQAGSEEQAVPGKQLIDWLVYVLVRIAICAVQALRIETCDAIARGLAWLAADVLRIRGKVVDENLRLAFPALTPGQRRDLSRRMWRHLILMVCEVAHAPRKIHRTNWYRYVTIEQKRRLLRCLVDPRPSLLVSGHFGTFALGGFFSGILVFPTFTVARPLDYTFLDRFVTRFRTVQGQHILPKQGSAAQIEAVLAAGHALTLLGDQHAGPKGCWVEFFGRPASCHKAIALFTLTAGAPMVVLYARRSGRPLEFEVGLAGIMDPAEGRPEASSVPALTRWYNERLEEAIRRWPEQYWWLHRRWKDPPRRCGAKRQAA